MTTPTPVPIDVTGAISVLNTLQVLPVIAIGALVFLASRLFKMFRR